MLIYSLIHILNDQNLNPHDMLQPIYCEVLQICMLEFFVQSMVLLLVQKLLCLRLLNILSLPLYVIHIAFYVDLYADPYLV